MKKLFFDFRKLLTEHKFTAAGLVPGLLPGSHIFFSILGGLIGFFLDILFREKKRIGEITAFIESPGQPSPGLTGEEAGTILKSLLCLQLQKENGLSGAFIKSSENRKILLSFFESTTGNIGILEIVIKNFSQRESTSSEKTAERLKPYMPMEDRIDFLKKLAGTFRNSLPQFTSVPIIRTAEIWEIPLREIPEDLISRQDEEENWKILGLPPGSSPVEIRKTYRKLSGQFHPDTTGVLSPVQRKNAEEAFLKIQKAYKRLMGIYKNSS